MAICNGLTTIVLGKSSYCVSCVSLILLMVIYFSVIMISHLVTLPLCYIPYLVSVNFVYLHYARCNFILLYI